MSSLEHDLYTSPDGLVLPLTVAGAQAKLTETGSALYNNLLSLATAQGPLQDGTTVTFQRLNARELLVTLSRQKCDRGEWWAIRARLLDYLRPNRLVAGPYSRPVPGYLRKYLPDGVDYRDLFVEARVIDFGAEPPDRTPGPLQCQVTFYAADPLYYGPPVAGAYALRGVGGLRFPVAFMAPVAIGPLPLVNVWIFGGGFNVAALNLTNLGTWHTYPIITITGPLTYASIANITTGETVTFNGAVPALVTLTIDLTYGQKRAYDSAGTDYSGYLDGDVGEFHIACAPEAPGGVNQVQVVINGGLLGAAVQVAFRSPYMGI
jgi:hypothetical protein